MRKLIIFLLLVLILLVPVTASGEEISEDTEYVTEESLIEESIISGLMDDFSYAEKSEIIPEEKNQEDIVSSDIIEEEVVEVCIEPEESETDISEISEAEEIPGTSENENFEPEEGTGTEAFAVTEGIIPEEETAPNTETESETIEGMFEEPVYLAARNGVLKVNGEYYWYKDDKVDTSRTGINKMKKLFEREEIIVGGSIRYDAKKVLT